MLTTMRRTAVPLLVLPLLLLAGCGSDDVPATDDATSTASAGPSSSAPTSSSPASSSSPSAAPQTGAGTAAGELAVELDRGEGGPPETYTLTCGPAPAGDLPDPAAACAQLAGQPDPFAELAPDIACTQLFGGPQTARVTGTWAGADVDLQLSRTDGCRISQWDRLGPLLPGPVG